MSITYEDEYKECNLEKHECLVCDKQFIVGTEMLEKQPICPYCDTHLTEKIAWTDNEKLEELDLGCLSLIQNL